MNKKELYEQPNVDVLELRSENVILTGSQDTLGINDWTTDGGIDIIF